MTSIIGVTNSGELNINTIKLGVGICGYDDNTYVSTKPTVNSKLFAEVKIIYSTENSVNIKVNELYYVSSEFGSTCYHTYEGYGEYDNIKPILNVIGDGIVHLADGIVDAYIPRIVSATSRAGNDQLKKFISNMFKNKNGSDVKPTNIYIY